ncbi:MAG: alpha/beta hydrolase [Candidatus Dependentiae bacterium]|nr:alpha/beta hydrolase [Candidatus Dependentiae bacterium]
MSLLITILKYIGLTILALIIIGLLYQYIATKLDEKAYPPIGKMIDIGGYKLHMIDSGTGGPTVVMDAGGGCTTLDWSLVQSKIAKFTRVVSYDRAGHAWSDASPLQRTSENIISELHTMLHNSGVPAPYILVGHSFGGFNMQLFAGKYPNEVAGVILVDSSSEETYQKVTKPSNFSIALLKTSFYLGIPRLMQYVPSIKRTNNERITKYPLNIQKQYFSQVFTTKYANACIQEGLFMEQNCNQLKLVKNLLKNKPLIVISAGKPMIFMDELKDWPTWQSNLVNKSSRGKQIIAQHSGHMINYDQPEIIVDAVREMVDELKSRNGN